MNPMTGFYEFPGQQPPQPQPDAPPAYDSLQVWADIWWPFENLLERHLIDMEGNTV